METEVGSRKPFLGGANFLAPVDAIAAHIRHVNKRQRLIVLAETSFWGQQISPFVEQVDRGCACQCSGEQPKRFGSLFDSPENWLLLVHDGDVEREVLVGSKALLIDLGVPDFPGCNKPGEPFGSNGS